MKYRIDHDDDMERKVEEEKTLKVCIQDLKLKSSAGFTSFERRA